MTFETLAVKSSEGNQSLIILVTGFVVVFAALLLLIGIIKVYSFIVTSALKRGGNKPPKEKTEKTSKTSSAPVIAPTSDAVDLQTIAVISAAVEAFYGEEKKVRVVSVKPTPVPKVRSEWATAGMMQNISARRGF